MLVRRSERKKKNEKRRQHYTIGSWGPLEITKIQAKSRRHQEKVGNGARKIESDTKRRKKGNLREADAIAIAVRVGTIVHKEAIGGALDLAVEAGVEVEVGVEVEAEATIVARDIVGIITVAVGMAIQVMTATTVAMRGTGIVVQ